MSESPKTTIPALAEVLSRPMDGVARVVLEHRRCERFRPIAFLELGLGLMCVACILPVILLLAMFGDADIELPTVSGRFYHRWHELRLMLLDPAGKLVATVSHVPATKDEGEAVVASVLAAAQRERVTIVETIAGSVRETLEVWYGGRPLLAHPDEAVEAQSTALLEQVGFEVRVSADEVAVIEEHPRLHPMLALALLVVLLPLAPLLLFVPAGKRVYRLLAQDLRRAPPALKIISVRAESIRTYVERGADRWNDTVLDGRDLYGISFSPALGYDRDVTRSAASLRFIGRARTTTLPVTRAAEAGRALRDLLVGATLRLRRARPELGLLGEGPVPAHCPFCAALYVMEPASRCPSCGARSGAAISG